MMNIKVKDIASKLNGTIEGDLDAEVSNFGKIEDAQAGDITFLANMKYAQYIYETNATAVLVSKDFVPEKVLNTTLIRVDNPYNALATLLTFYQQMQPKEQGIAATAYIHESVSLPEDVYIAPGVYISGGVKLGKGVRIYPNAFIGKNVIVGEETTIYPSVTIYDNCKVGKRCILHAGAVIGADGFGFVPQKDAYQKIPQIGDVILEDDVEIGANTCVDRAVMGSTLISRGVKIDNLVQIGHNVVVGDNTVIAAQAGIAGSTKIGAWNMLGGQSGLAGHIKTANNVTIAAQTGIISDLKTPGETYFGSPAHPIKTAMRGHALLPKLPDMNRSIGRLERQISELQETIQKLQNSKKEF